MYTALTFSDFVLSELYQIEGYNNLHTTSLFKLIPNVAFLSIEALGTSFVHAVQSAMSSMH